MIFIVFYCLNLRFYLIFKFIFLDQLNLLAMFQFLTNISKFRTTHRSGHRRFSIKKGVLKNFAKFTGKHLCQSLFFQACNFIKKETLAQVFFCAFCEIFKNRFFTEHLWMIAFELRKY